MPPRDRFVRAERLAGLRADHGGFVPFADINVLAQGRRVRHRYFDGVLRLATCRNRAR